MGFAISWPPWVLLSYHLPPFRIFFSMMLAESAFRPDADCPPHPLPPVFSVLCFPREMPYIDDWKSPLDRKRRRLCNRLPLFFESPLLPLPLDICPSDCNPSAPAACNYLDSGVWREMTLYGPCGLYGNRVSSFRWSGEWRWVEDDLLEDAHHWFTPSGCPLAAVYPSPDTPSFESLYRSLVPPHDKGMAALIGW